MEKKEIVTVGRFVHEATAKGPIGLKMNSRYVSLILARISFSKLLMVKSVLMPFWILTQSNH